jgi:hypothetical protein
MMPMRMRRKSRALEKVENRCRSATAKDIVPPCITFLRLIAAGNQTVPPSPMQALSLPEISRFAARFVECCAALVKLCRPPRNVLAMQRGAL